MVSFISRIVAVIVLLILPDFKWFTSAWRFEGVVQFLYTNKFGNGEARMVRARWRARAVDGASTAAREGACAPR
jgi:hypothetical protein